MDESVAKEKIELNLLIEAQQKAYRKKVAMANQMILMKQRDLDTKNRSYRQTVDKSTYSQGFQIGIDEHTKPAMEAIYKQKVKNQGLYRTSLDQILFKSQKEAQELR